ncbi:MAG: ATP-dependent DNA helicase RecG, partial [uncultured bacterium]
TVMLVEHAERFGLSQLHQLRGRVGRAGHQSYCFLMAAYQQSEDAGKRLSIMEETDDGFKISEEDLKIRGPGDFMGTRQAGLPDFKLAYLLNEDKLMVAARKRAQEILNEDISLALEKYQMIKKILKKRWLDKLNLTSIS